MSSATDISTTIPEFSSTSSKLLTLASKTAQSQTTQISTNRPISKMNLHSTFPKPSTTWQSPWSSNPFLSWSSFFQATLQPRSWSFFRQLTKWDYTRINFLLSTWNYSSPRSLRRIGLRSMSIIICTLIKKIIISWRSYSCLREICRGIWTRTKKLKNLTSPSPR